MLISVDDRESSLRDSFCWYQECLYQPVIFYRASSSPGVVSHINNESHPVRPSARNCWKGTLKNRLPTVKTIEARHLVTSRTGGQFQICPRLIQTWNRLVTEICPESYRRTWEQNLWTRTSHHVVSSTQFSPEPASSCGFHPQNPGKTETRRISKVLPRRILAELLSFFLAVHVEFTFRSQPMH